MWSAHLLSRISVAALSLSASVSRDSLNVFRKNQAQSLRFDTLPLDI
jgi:hypothetical protein